MSKIRDLVNFEKVKDVIDIDALSDKKSMVDNYVITPSLEEQLLYIFDDLKGSTHKSPQIIGGYGSGKSHLLAFIISLLTEPNLVDSIQNEKVRSVVSGINREFCVLHWELQPNDVALSEYFYDRLELQLEENYGIKYKAPASGIIDHKREIIKVLDKVKQGNPSRGLVVVVDEISDFLKQKRTKGEITRDVQFLRVLGQVAQESDFVFIGAMQEHVFTNPKYVDEAEGIGRVSERFNIVTIKREDIKKVISKRVLAKSPEQRLELENLFEEYTKHFPALKARIDEYIDLFPIHPYVIQVFSELPYFEKRGVIQFTIQEVEKILDKEFPYMITYDRIFNEIVSRHTIKNLESVAPIVEAVQTLDSKIDLLENRHQETAHRLINSLGVLKLYGKSTNNGATLEELANTLLILPANQLMEARDELELVLTNLRKVTDGQFVNKTDDGYYYLDLSLDIDYDQVILRRAENLPGGALDEEILQILKDQLLLEQNGNNGVFYDTCRWPSRRSFREGTFIYYRKDDMKKEFSGDYLVVIMSPFVNECPYNVTPGTLILKGQFDQTAVDELKKLTAAKALRNENFHRSIMEKKYVIIRKNFIVLFNKAYLETGQIETNNGVKSLKSLISREFTNFDELLSEIKPSLLEESFSNKYPQHPHFSQAITRDNIKGEFSNVLKEVFTRSHQQQFFSSAKSVLGALDLVDENGNITTSKGKAVNRIKQLAKENQGKNVGVRTIEEELSESPFGYDPLMAALVILILTYNGEISLKAAGGKTITSSEVVDVFSTGIEAFSNILYLTQESDFDIQPVIELFHVLSLPPDKLRKTSKRGEAIQQFRTRYLEINDQIEYINNKLARLSLYEANIIDLEGLEVKHELIKELPLDDFEAVKAPNDFKKIAYEKDQIAKIGSSYQTLKKINHFYEFYFNNLEKEVEYVREVIKIIQEYLDMFETDDILHYAEEAYSVLNDSSRLLNVEELNPLLGKLQQAHKKYKIAYYNIHESYVGGKVDWNRLDDLSVNLIYTNLKKLKNISVIGTHSFIKVENELSRLKNLKCVALKPDHLDDKVVCPSCGFPKEFKMLKVNQAVEELEDSVSTIYEEWEAEILNELQNYRDNIQYLPQSEQQLIQNIIKKGAFPETINDELTVALNNLFKELEIIELTPQMIKEELFSDSRVLDYRNFTQKLDAFKQKLYAGHDLENVRVKLIEGDE